MIQDRCLRVLILSFCHQERIMKNLTTRLSSTQQELDVLEEQRFGQNGGLTNATYSTVSQMNELRKALNRKDSCLN